MHQLFDQPWLCCRLSAFQEFGDVADPDPYATNKYLIKEINRFNLAYLHMVEPRASGAEDTAGQFEDQDLSPFRKLFNGPFMAAGAAIYCFMGSIHHCEALGYVQHSIGVLC